MVEGKILLIDDEIDILELYSSYFNARGIDTLCASSGNQAIDILKKYKDNIDIIISDYRMPDGDGGVVANYVREIIDNSKNGDYPLMIVFTGSASVNIDHEGYLMGFKLIRKPLTPSKLLDIILEELEKRKN